MSIFVSLIKTIMKKKTDPLSTYLLVHILSINKNHEQ